MREETPIQQAPYQYIRENEIPKPTFQFGLKIFIL